MSTDNIDDLFRDRLEGHASPPGEALWARLQAHGGDDVSGTAPSAPGLTPPDNAPERAGTPVALQRSADPNTLDALFRTGLTGLTTAPGRQVWERLEDEHLQPRQRRAAWWPMALAAAVALLLVAGGAGLWLGFPFGQSNTVQVAARRGDAQGSTGTASQRKNTAAATVTKAQASPRLVAKNEVVAKAAAGADLEPRTAAAGNFSEALEKKNAGRATRQNVLASSGPKADATTSGPGRRHPTGPARHLDAAAEPTRSVARASARAAAADERRQPATPAPVVAAVPNPAAEIVPARAEPTAPALARTSGVITVEVRGGGAVPALRPAQAVSAAVAAAAAEPAEGRRRLGGRLLQQAGHLVRGERVSLAEITGLPENLTLQATVAGRSLTKTIQL